MTKDEFKKNIIDEISVSGSLGIEIKEEEIMAVAEATAVDTVGNMPFAVTAKDIYAAILAADAIGRTML